VNRAAVGLVAGGAGLCVLLVGGVVLLERSNSKPLGTVAEARAFYASQPEMLRPFPYTEVPQGLKSLSAQSCGACHREIYEEWRVSTHARAWMDDAQFQEELHKNDGVPERDTRWICVNCHTPLENQLEFLVAGVEEGHLGKPRLIPNPNYDISLQQEAITCASCHVRQGVVLGPYGDSEAPHPVRKAPELLESAACTSCHEASAYLDDVRLGCAFTTGSEVAAGPHRGRSCQSCHMPEVTRPVATGKSPRKTRRHWFGGSLIPKRPSDEEDLAPVRGHYPDGVSLTWGEVPQALAPGAAVELQFSASNDEAGHQVPTGDPERFLLLRAEARDAKGNLLGERELRIGSVYEWEPLKLVSDNRLEPGEVRSFSLSFQAPSAGQVTLSLRASKFRLSPENLAYHDLEGRAVPGRVYFEESRQVQVEESKR
jgi:cytochrome c554/c'-like protein